MLKDVDQDTGEDLNPTRSRQPVGGEVSEMARNPDRYPHKQYCLQKVCFLHSTTKYSCFQYCEPSIPLTAIFLILQNSSSGAKDKLHFGFHQSNFQPLPLMMKSLMHDSIHL